MVCDLWQSVYTIELIGIRDAMVRVNLGLLTHPFIRSIEIEIEQVGHSVIPANI